MSVRPYQTNPFLIIIGGVKRAFSHSQQISIMLIIAPMALGLISFIFQIFIEVFRSVSKGEGATASTGLVGIGVVLLILAFLLQIFVQNLFLAFQGFAAHKMALGLDAPFGTSLEASFSKFWKVFLATILVFVNSLPYYTAIMLLVVVNVFLASVGPTTLAIGLPLSILLSIFLIVLIVRVYLRFALASIALFDGVATASAALEKSKQLTHGRLGEVFGVTSIGAFVPFISALCVSGGLSVLYAQLKQARQDKTELPKQSLLNYLPVAAFLVGIIFVVAAVGLAMTLPVAG